MSQVYVAPMTPTVKKLMIAMGAVWIVVQILADKFLKFNISNWFILHPDMVIEKFYAWQLLTYMFFHALSPFHLFFNGLMLWFFGAELEKHWGSRFFTIYFFVCGAGAAIVYSLGVAVYALMSGDPIPMTIPVLGASGALFGILVAYGIVFSERVIYFMGLFPMKAKYFAMIAAALDFSSLMTTGFAGSEVAYLCHVGGAIVGFAFLWGHTRWKLGKTKSKIKKSTASLKLVVDNEKKGANDDKGPKYWN